MRYRYVQKCTLAKMANTRQNLSKNSNEMAKVRFESGYFDENGDFDKNGELSPKFDECSYDVAKGPFWEWHIWRKYGEICQALAASQRKCKEAPWKVANSAKIDFTWSLSKNWNEIAKWPLKVAMSTNVFVLHCNHPSYPGSWFRYRQQ